MSKFHELATYKSGLGASYQLLPKKFERLDHERYVVTNLTGEFHLLPNATLHAFLTHKLPNTSPEYDELKSKHFLFDADSDVVIDLLALKTRTKFERLSHFTSLHL